MRFQLISTHQNDWQHLSVRVTRPQANHQDEHVCE